MRRKHVIVVEITFDDVVTSKEAKNLVGSFIKQGIHAELNGTYQLPYPGVTKFEVKEGNRVFTSIRNNSK